MRGVPERLNETVHVLSAYLENTAHTKIERQCLFAGFPVKEQLWLRPDKPAVAELISEEGLQEHSIRIFSILVAGKRDRILNEHSQ